MTFTLSGRTHIAEVCRKRTEKANLLEYANESRYSGAFNDVEIYIGDDHFPANRLVLSCFSPFFEKLFRVEMKEKYQSSVEIQCVEENSMKSIIEFIYTGCIYINSENVCLVLYASDYLQIKEVKQFCIEFLDAAITPDNSFIVLGIADLYRNDKLKAHAFSVIVENLDIASTTIEFKRLSKEDLINCLSKHEGRHTNETSVCNAIIRWAKHDEESRAHELTQLLQLVNFSDVSYAFLKDVVLKEALVIQNLELCQLLLHHYSQLSSKLKQKEDMRTIVSLGGNQASSRVTEIYNFWNNDARIYPCLPSGRASGCSVVLFDYLYYAGGRIQHGVVFKTVLRMNIKEKKLKWEEVAPMHVSRYSAEAAVFNDALVVVGGCDGKTSLQSSEMYSPVSNTWKGISPMIKPRGGHAVAVCEGGLYSIGGYGNDTCLASVERTLSCDGNWKYVEPMNTPRRWLAAVSFNGCIYAIGGQTNQPLQSVEKYDPATNKWSYISEMNFPRRSPKACVLQGRIFVVGGVNAQMERIREVECYDPFFDKWYILGKTEPGLLNHSIVAM